MPSETYDPSEQDELLDTFREMLKAATGDGGKKRAAGTKPSWKVDPSHLAAVFSHLNAYFHGEKVDPDSGAHPFVHAAWRMLAIAWQETEYRKLMDDFTRTDNATGTLTAEDFNAAIDAMNRRVEWQ
jgi:hypothetical protein